MWGQIDEIFSTSAQGEHFPKCGSTAPYSQSALGETAPDCDGIWRTRVVSQHIKMPKTLKKNVDFKSPIF